LARRVPGSSASLRRERSREIPGLSQKSQPVGRLTGGNGAQTTTHPQALRTGKGATGQESVGMSGVQESLQQQDSAAGAATAAKAGAWVTNIHATARATLRKPWNIISICPTCSGRSSLRHNPAGKPLNKRNFGSLVREALRFRPWISRRARPGLLSFSRPTPGRMPGQVDAPLLAATVPDLWNRFLQSPGPFTN
jgi:hypothetical protein